MTIYRDLHQKTEARERVLVLGFFDGVHLGHQSLLAEMRKQAEAKRLLPTVFTFADPPGRIFSKGEGFPGLLQTKEDRQHTLLSLGAEDLMISELIPEIFGMEPEAFLDLCLKQSMNVRHVVVGADFTFGKNARGTVEMLENYCRHNNIGLSVKPDYMWKGEILSSSSIRRRIMEGHAAEAAVMMGRYFSHREYVTGGKRLGRRLGFPTLNIQLDPSLVLPRKGVYASVVEWNGQTAEAISNIGVRPTVEDTQIAQSETYIYGSRYPGYGEQIRVSYLAFMRPETKFSGVDELQKQVLSDIERVKAYHKNGEGSFWSESN